MTVSQQIMPRESGHGLGKVKVVWESGEKLLYIYIKYLPAGDQQRFFSTTAAVTANQY